MLINLCCVCRKCLTFNAYQLNLSYQLWVRSIFVYQNHIKSVFEYEIAFWSCVQVLWIYKGYFIVKMLVWNVRIKACWFTNNIIMKVIRTYDMPIREFSYTLYSGFLFESILIKIYKNTNNMKRQLFHFFKFDLKGIFILCVHNISLWNLVF